VIDGARRCLNFFNFLTVPERKASFGVEATRYIEGTVGVRFFNKVPVFLSFCSDQFRLLLFLDEVVGTKPVSHSYPPGPGVIERF
jgi:hypothetical protein